MAVAKAQLSGIDVRVERARWGVDQGELAKRLCAQRESTRRGKRPRDWAWVVILIRVEMCVLNLSQEEFRWIVDTIEMIGREIVAERDAEQAEAGQQRALVEA